MLGRVLLVLFLIAPPIATPGAAAQAPCPGDCNGANDVTVSDLARLNALMLRCRPCGTRPGAVAAGCSALPGGCPAADLNEDGCILASEFGFIIREATKPLLPTPGGTCRIDASRYPRRPLLPPCRLDCNGDGTTTASELGRLNSLLLRCTTCADGSAGAPPDGCPAWAFACPVADLDHDGCIRKDEIQNDCRVGTQTD